jgi:hypothetical protein
LMEEEAIGLEKVGDDQGVLPGPHVPGQYPLCLLVKVQQGS